MNILDWRDIEDMSEQEATERDDAPKVTHLEEITYPVNEYFEKKNEKVIKIEGTRS